jgi:hypothetical protein
MPHCTIRAVHQRQGVDVSCFALPRSSELTAHRDEAFLIAVNMAKLPSVPQQILKDILRPPNSASRDD